MLGKKIIIDGLYKDDTTVVLYKDGEIKDLRHQNATQNFIKGNIYLAKIEKIEPGLQAAFVNYGKDKAGFLQFSEIHPKYYDGNGFENRQAVSEIKVEQPLDEDNITAIKHIHKQLVTAPSHKYVPIHNLIKVDQTVLVQIEKDERGTKGASLTTFLSLAGRYCVLLLNSTKTNIVSKLVEDEGERQRLKEIANELCMLQVNTSIMLKPSAAYKTKIEITRDFGYLMRLWKNIQKHVANSTAPLFIHEEGDIIKKSVRDLYDGEVDEIIVSGEEAYKNASAFMKLLMPRYLNKVKYYDKAKPIFIEYGLHEQIKAVYSDIISLPAGGYLVINQVEALTSIDVNSGRAKSEDRIEDTASKINLEAAHEVVNQIKLRNISGLIVVDFIDMFSQEGKDSIEKIVRDGLNSQSSKAIVSKMSEFALLEISRQRIGNSLYECVFHRCRECNGRGRIRSFELTAVAILKAVRNEISLDQEFEDDMVIEVSAKRDVIMEMINDRKQELCEIEAQSNIKINLRIDESATLDTFFIERKKLKKYKISHTALSTIDKTHYMDQGVMQLPSKNIVDIPKQKFNKTKKVGIITEVRGHKISLIKRIFTKLLK